MGLKVRGPFIELPPVSPSRIRDESVTILSHYDGIVCLSLHSDNIALYNPAINECKIIPESCIPDGNGYYVARV